MENYIEIKLPAISKNESLARNAIALFCVELNPTVDELEAVGSMPTYAAVDPSISFSSVPGMMSCIMPLHLSSSTKFFIYQSFCNYLFATYKDRQKLPYMKQQQSRMKLASQYASLTFIRGCCCHTIEESFLAATD